MDFGSPTHHNPRAIGGIGLVSDESDNENHAPVQHLPSDQDALDSNSNLSQIQGGAEEEIGNEQVLFDMQGNPRSTLCEIQQMRVRGGETIVTEET